MIITGLGQRKNLHKMLKIKQFVPKISKCHLYVLSYNLEYQITGFVDVKRVYNRKDERVIFLQKSKQ